MQISPQAKLELERIHELASLKHIPRLVLWYEYVNFPPSTNESVTIKCNKDGNGFYGNYFQENKEILSNIITEKRFNLVIS